MPYLRFYDAREMILLQWPTNLRKATVSVLNQLYEQAHLCDCSLALSDELVYCMHHCSTVACVPGST